MSNSCRMCGEVYDTEKVQDFRGHWIWLCRAGDCQMEFEREEQESEEYAFQDAHDEVDARFERTRW